MATCNGEQNCNQRLTHIDHKGWTYCSDHAPRSDGWRRVRKMRAGEQNLIAAGQPIPSYKLGPKPLALSA